MLATRPLKIGEHRQERSHQLHRKGGSTPSEGISKLAAFAIPAYYPKAPFYSLKANRPAGSLFSTQAA